MNYSQTFHSDYPSQYNISPTLNSCQYWQEFNVIIVFLAIQYTELGYNSPLLCDTLTFFIEYHFFWLAKGRLNTFFLTIDVRFKPITMYTSILMNYKGLSSWFFLFLIDIISRKRFKSASRPSFDTIEFFGSVLKLLSIVFLLLLKYSPNAVCRNDMPSSFLLLY